MPVPVATDPTPADGVHLITGSAGFIGFHLAERWLQEGRRVVGLDNLNDYYDPSLKEARLARLTQHPSFANFRIGLEDRDAVAEMFDAVKPAVVVNLAAQAGVRYSLENPRAYTDSNVSGFMNILEGCRDHAVSHLVYASSSSVYGLNAKAPFAVGDTVDHPISLYAATKKANELMAHTYSHLYGLPATGLRFFTVYGPWGRPDMAYYKFTKAIFEGQPIQVYNHGKMRRDFTYIDDIVEGVAAVADRPARPNQQWDPANPDSGTSSAPYRLQNIGNNNPIELMRFIETLETAIGRKAEKQMLPMQPGDVQSTYADIEPLAADTGVRPTTQIEEGLERFVHWFQDYYGIRA
ncbi:MAG: NAD-dependent epimerase [Pseudomonadota bacterium]